MSLIEINLNYLFTYQPNIRDNICSFLNNNELLGLQQINKSLQKSSKQIILSRNNNIFNNWKEQTLYSKPKNNKQLKVIHTQHNTVLKMNIFELPSQILKKELWKKVPNDKQLSLRIRDDKFIVEHNNLFFENQNKELMFINRTLIDQKLNMNEYVEPTKEDNKKYEKLYNQSEFSVESYDFSSMQSLLKRQEDITKDLNQNKKPEKIDTIDSINAHKKISVILCNGGQFCIGIFEKNKCIFHKSDHKYVTRKKAGGRQLIKDKNSGSNIKSMGSQIRRDQEVKHQTNVHNILTENFDQIDSCDIVLLQAPGINKQILIDENEPLLKLKHKIRNICITAKKANYTEVERIYKAITKVYFVFDKDDE